VLLADDRNFRNGTRAACRLDDEQNGYGNRDDATTDTVRVYARTSGGKLDRFRALCATCKVETATPNLGSVTENDSARWLVGLVKQSKDVLPALALNRGERARDALAGIARTDAREETRKQAVFWLAMLRGSEGADITSSVMLNDKDEDIRKHAAFALAQSAAPRAAADLIRLGNTDRAGEVRGQAWFWLAHMGAPEAEQGIAAALRKETEEDVRDRAIVAHSRLPD
jgi:hypothetical protein